MEKDLTFMLIETADEMERTLSHIDKVTAEQNELIELVNESDKAKKFEGFTHSLKNDIDNTLNQKAQLEERHAMLCDVIKECQSNAHVASVVSTLCRAFGIFGMNMPEEPAEEGGKIIEFPKKD
mgnify:FL=1|jgi:hypothetical protein